MQLLGNCWWLFVISRCDRDETDVLLMCCASAEGPTEVNMTELPIEEVELQLRQLGIQFGGHWRPKDCKPRWKVSLLCLYESTILKWEKKKFTILSSSFQQLLIIHVASVTLKHDDSENITNKTKQNESNLLFYLSAFSTVMLIRNSHNLFSGKKTKQKKNRSNWLKCKF